MKVLLIFVALVACHVLTTAGQRAATDAHIVERYGAEAALYAR